MVNRFFERDEYIRPLIETGELIPEILCESPDADLEFPETGDSWTF